MTPRVPTGVVELLRFCVVVFFAGLGYQVATYVGPSDQVRVGPVDGVGLGVLLGAAVGYVLGGALARLTVRAVERTESQMRDRSAEQVLAGVAGGVLGVLGAAGVTWPMLLLGATTVTVPIFVFVVVSSALLGYRLGLARRHGVLGLIGATAGLTEATSAAPAELERVLDTSVAIDGRIVDVVRAGFLVGTLLVPAPVLGELQGLADSGDDSKRTRGRRGLEVLEALRRERGVDVVVIDDEAVEVPEVDGKLVRTCLDRKAALVTLDTNLAKVAALAGARVQNLHALALALRPPVSAGDSVAVLLIKPGKEREQAVGYLDDGTMVVVERARARVGQEETVAVTSVLTTANGRMVFARLLDGQ